jgi:hypothetical protein
MVAAQAGGGGVMTPSRTSWLAPVVAALAVDRSVTWFFRDDDAGWADDALASLSDLFGEAGVVLDVAAIPAAVAHGGSALLRRLTGEGVIKVHQHGFSHANHERAGKRCEFGPSRDLRDQLADLVHGRTLLAEQLDGQVEGVFVPPWNRCSDLTIGLLEDLGFAGISRDDRGGEAPGQRIAEVGVTVDWVGHWRDGGPYRLGQALADAVAETDGHVGVMFHHAAMGPDDRRAVTELLGTISCQPAATTSTLGQLVTDARAHRRQISWPAPIAQPKGSTP